MYLGDAVGTHRKPRNIQKRLAADATVGWKQDREETCSYLMKPDSSVAGRSFLQRCFPQNNRRP
jgi:hypothetical protein